MGSWLLRFFFTIRIKVPTKTKFLLRFPSLAKLYIQTTQVESCCCHSLKVTQYLQRATFLESFFLTKQIKSQLNIYHFSKNESEILKRVRVILYKRVFNKMNITVRCQNPRRDSPANFLRETASSWSSYYVFLISIFCFQ